MVQLQEKIKKDDPIQSNSDNKILNTLNIVPAIKTEDKNKVVEN